MHTANQSQNSLRRLNGAIEQLGFAGYYGTPYEFSALTAAVTLKQPGDFIFLDDKLMKHSVLPVVRARPEEVGYRDVLIAMFTRRDQPGEGGA
ncbi:2OG-Fe dioxygenase family protein [Verminephrobacter aporrectodeae]|uniref:2OG-Fe dioxygenase family protein n=1 Tax=Verminephrobacter aporrectodeae TaxID=1110389 RepID=UPI00023776E5|nr:2OG-Fe dioxygenase family protein [Verminephrobacter aporrectodeae]